MGGSHRSGTTLLRRLLNGHSRLYCPAEVKFYKDLLGQFPKDPLAHGRLGSSIEALGLPQEVWLDEFGRAFVRCFECAMQRHGKVRWVDKNPENALNIAHWDRLLGGKLNFVLVVRHPADIIASMEEIKMNRVIPTTLEGRADHVVQYIQSGLDYLSSHPERSALVRYEDLVRDPRGTLVNLLTAVDEEFEEDMLTSLGGDHGEGLEDPKARGRASVSSENVERFTRAFDIEQIAILRRHIGGIMDRLDYKL